MSLKSFEVVTDVEGAVTAAYEVLSGLRDEAREVAEAIEENFSGTTRYDAMSSAADALDGFVDDVPEFEELLGCLPVVYRENRRRGVSRSTRRDNAVAALSAAIDALQSFETDAPEGEDEESDDGDPVDVSELVTQLENAMSDAENCEFPGMMG